MLQCRKAQLVLWCIAKAVQEYSSHSSLTIQASLTAMPTPLSACMARR
jgi:hypothetical protein